MYNDAYNVQYTQQISICSFCGCQVEINGSTNIRRKGNISLDTALAKRAFREFASFKRKIKVIMWIKESKCVHFLG